MMQVEKHTTFKKNKGWFRAKKHTQTGDFFQQTSALLGK